MKDWYCIYVMARLDGIPAAPVKIGIAKNPSKRIKELQTGCPFKIVLISFFPVPNRETAVDIERAAHELLNPHHEHGEWFDFDPWAATATICGIFESVSDDFPEIKENILELSNSNANIRRCSYALEKVLEHRKYHALAAAVGAI